MATRVASSAMTVTGWKAARKRWANHSAPLRRISSARLSGAERQRDDHEHEDRVEQDRERHFQAGRARHQELHDRRERDEHDQVVHRDLHQRVGGVAVGEVRPDEDHRRAGRGGQDDDAGHVLARQLRADQRQEEVLEEEPAEEGHRERLHQPVHDEGDDEARGPPADAADRREVDLEHHRVDHQPDEDGDRDVDLAALRRTPDREPPRRSRGTPSRSRRPSAMHAATQRLR